jgi:pyruvate dehydrogenase E2 component (dihydrolipoamide acetyltransferase)
MAETINMPKLGFDMAEGTLVRWVRNIGETIHKGDVLAEIETDKATVEVESSASGVVLAQLVDAGAVVPVNTPIAVVGAEGEKIGEQSPVVSGQSAPEEVKPVPATPEPAPVATAVPAPAAQSSIVNQQSQIVRASPLAKKMASVRSLDLAHVTGTGPGGRIVRRDVEAALKSQESPVASQIAATAPTNDYSTMRLSDQTIQTTKLRQAIGRRLVESKTTIPHFYVTHEYRMDALMELRKQVNAYLAENEKISVNDFIVKAAALTLRQYSNLNASLNGDKIVRHGAINIGVAVTVEGGLLTIVVRDADQKSLRQISLEVKAMAARAREGKVKPEDVDGSTFSTSNLGMYDVENFVAIINPPEAAILAIGSAREVPVVEAGAVKPGWRMKATLSVDHRISDGAEAAQFMQAMAKYLQEPLRLMI